jgi:virulence-associated protein VagC
MGHKHGVARGTAVFTSNGSNDADLPRDFHLPSERLRVWSRDHGVTLDESPESLSLLDEHLDAWNADATHHDKVDLSNEVGIYVGSVIVKHVEGAHWRVWPNGHPVIQLGNGATLDVTRMTTERLNHTTPSLDAIFSSAQPS